MQRIVFHSIIGAISLLAGSTVLGDEGARKSAATTRLDGAWRMVAYKPAGARDYVKLPKGWESIKLVSGGRFVWTTVKDGKISGAAGGKVFVHDDDYIERIEYVSDAKSEWMVGRTGVFKARLDGDKWYHEGVIKTDNGESVIIEIWERVR